MADIDVKHKRALSDAIADNLTRMEFSVSLPRRAYRDDDDEGGGGGFLLETHPLLANQQDGAPSDLSHDVNNNPEAMETIEERQDVCAELKKQADLKKGQQLTSMPTLSRS